MALYEFRCVTCGRFESAHPMGSAPATRSCPRCASESPRVMSAPALATVSPQVSRLRDREARSAEAPEVTRHIPPAAGRAWPVPANPLHAKLPRS